MLITEMTDRINATEIIYEEPSVIEIELIQGKCLVAIAEETSTLTGDVKVMKKKSTRHLIEMTRSCTNYQQTNIVSLSIK